MIKKPTIPKPQKFDQSLKAVEKIETIYKTQVAYLRGAFDDFSHGRMPKEKKRGFYPYLRINVTEASFKKLQSGSRYSYGFVSKPGLHETTLTRPDFFENYYTDQISHLLNNHDVPVEVGLSTTPIPIHFALGEDFHLENALKDEQIEALPNIFDQPDLEIMDDQIANATYIVGEGQAAPLAPVAKAPRRAGPAQAAEHGQHRHADEEEGDDLHDHVTVRTAPRRRDPLSGPARHP